MTTPIISLMTPRGVGGIAVIRLCGDSSDRILRRVFADKRMQPRGPIAGGRIAYGFIVEPASREPVDEVLVARVGENDYEVNCHGGYAAVREVMRVLGECGAKEVPPEESLARGGLLQGRDAVQREAYRLLLYARSERAARHLLSQFDGVLSKELARMVSCIENADYEGALAMLDDLLRGAAFGIALSEPVRVVIAGLPNSGKSSLLNALVGRERAIVDEQAGTTRDIVDAETLIKGVPFHLHDTAGLREASKDPEIQGVARARAAAAGADCLLVLLDLSREVTPEEAAFLMRAAKEERVVIACLNKCDLARSDLLQGLRALAEHRPSACKPQDALEEGCVELVQRCVAANVPVCFASALTGEGMETLRNVIYSLCIPSGPGKEDAPLIFARRHLNTLRPLRALLEAALGGDGRAASRAKETLRALPLEVV